MFQSDFVIAVRQLVRQKMALDPDTNQGIVENILGILGADESLLSKFLAMTPAELKGQDFDGGCSDNGVTRYIKPFKRVES